jgi:hypothetical protein
MNQKDQITHKILELLGLAADDKSFKRYRKEWWVNPRNKDQGGLKLTDAGWIAIESAKIKHHKIKLENNLEHTNQTLIKLDRYMDCPWYIQRQNIYVYSERMAVQLILFTGNLQKFINAKTKVI